MNVVVERFLELTAIATYRTLNETEAREYLECRQYVADRQWKMAKLLNLSTLAYQTEEWEWLHSICKQIESI